MRFWSREILGWLLILLALMSLGLAMQWLATWKEVHEREWTPVVEAALATIIGLILLRGGIKLLNIAVAARILAQTQKRSGVRGQESGVRGRE